MLGVGRDFVFGGRFYEIESEADGGQEAGGDVGVLQVRRKGGRKGGREGGRVFSFYFFHLIIFDINH